MGGTAPLKTELWFCFPLLRGDALLPVGAPIQEEVGEIPALPINLLFLSHPGPSQEKQASVSCSLIQVTAGHWLQGTDGHQVPQGRMRGRRPPLTLAQRPSTASSQRMPSWGSELVGNRL